MKEGLSQFFTTRGKASKMTQNTEKHLTKYDRKRLAKEAAAKREKRNQIITIAAVIAVIAAIVALLVLVPLFRRNKAFSEYIRVNDVSVSQLEFNYYKGNIVNGYSAILPYYGVDTSVPYDQQIFDAESGLTWDDYFDQLATDSIRVTKAVLSDVTANGLTFDISKEYNARIASMKAEASAAGIKFDNYLFSLYGNAASEKTIKPFIEEELIYSAYYDYLTEKFTPTDEEAQAKYDENPDQYDSVDYRVLSFKADVMENASEEEVSAAMDTVLASAKEMLDKVNAGGDFETLCAEYAPEAQRANYEDTETDYSLVTNLTLDASSHAYKDWLFEDRETGDTTLYTDEESNTVYVLKFEKRYTDEKILETIKSNTAMDAVSAHIDTLMENFIVSDPKGNLPFLTKEQ